MCCWCNARLPPSPDGEWWEMTDESTGLPYYYHTKTGETVWERPTDAFVIPLNVLQVRFADRDVHRSSSFEHCLSEYCTEPSPVTHEP